MGLNRPSDQLFHILHDILDSYFIIHTCRLKEIDSLRGTKDAVDIVDASAQVLDAAYKKCKLEVLGVQYLHRGMVNGAHELSTS